MTGILYHDFYICGTCQAMVAENARLTAELSTAEFDAIWGIYKREGLERRMPHLRSGYAALVIDLDQMHDRNLEFGHAGVDWRMTQVFLRIRENDTYAGRWKRGDEVVVFVHQDDAEGLAIRALVTCELYGMPATMVLVSATLAGIASGIAAIEVAKKAGKRGQILEALV